MSNSLEVLPADLLPQLIAAIGDRLHTHVKTLNAIAISGPNHLDLQFSKSYDFSKRICERPENREHLQRTLSQILKIPVQISISLLAEEDSSPLQPTDQRQPTRSAPDPEDHPYVSRVMQIFGASLVNIESHVLSAPRREEAVEAEPLE